MDPPLTRPVLHYFVLDALANDIESREHILALLNHPDIGWTAEYGGRIPPEAVTPILHDLVREGLIRAYSCAPGDVHLEPVLEGYIPSDEGDEVYFGLTPRGRAIHAAWLPDE